MELRSSFKEHKREEKKSEGGAGKGVERVFFLKQLEQRGLTGRVLSTLGHGAPEVTGHLYLSHLHAKRRAWWFSAGLKSYLNALWVEGAL